MLYSTDLLLIYAKVQINFDSTKRYRTFDLKNHRNAQSFFIGYKQTFISFFPKMGDTKVCVYPKKRVARRIL